MLRWLPPRLLGVASERQDSNIKGETNCDENISERKVYDVEAESLLSRQSVRVVGFDCCFPPPCVGFFCPPKRQSARVVS